MAILAAPQPRALQSQGRKVPRLENGDHLDEAEFLRRYEAAPEIKKAELIHGIVYVSPPLRTAQDGVSDSCLQMCLGVYAAGVLGVKAYTNLTVHLSPQNIPQPDACLLSRTAIGGRTRIDECGYVHGAPELIVEIAASSASFHTCEKLTAYREAGVQEYVIWRTEDDVIDWHVLDNGHYGLLAADEEGIVRSRVFPGLWLNVTHLLALDRARVLETLQAGLASPEHAAFVEGLRAGEQRVRE